LPLSQSINFGNYEARRRDLLKRGRKWFVQRVKKWNSRITIPEIDAGRVKFKFPEEKEFYFGTTRLRFTKPLFHGIEFSEVGWVFATIVERKNEKLIHSSDLNGPKIIEDYAE
jgi:predicted metallo-beta-lactamase superfamily hydrolase